MPIKIDALLRREMITCIIISVVLSGLFHLLVFGLQLPAPLWGIGKYVFDFAPQSFAIALMGCLVPGLMTRKAVLAGKVEGVNSFPAVGTVIGRALMNGIAALVLGTGIAAIVFWLSGMTEIAPIPGLAVKLIYGGALGAFLTPRYLRGLFKAA